MQRYFMTIPEASKLVLQASVLGTSGDVFVLDMGEQVKILDLAKKMITLSGFIPDVDIQIVFTGIRPGEKTYEELFFDYETTFSTEHPKIRNAKLKTPAHSVMRSIVELENFPANTAPGILREKLFELVPEALFGGK
jgi:FlaA1/EpsC-like NDP-sugar epimerase